MVEQLPLQVGDDAQSDPAHQHRLAEIGEAADSSWSRRPASGTTASASRSRATKMSPTTDSMSQAEGGLGAGRRRSCTGRPPRAASDRARDNRARCGGPAPPSDAGTAGAAERRSRRGRGRRRGGAAAPARRPPGRACSRIRRCRAWFRRRAPSPRRPPRSPAGRRRLCPSRFWAQGRGAVDAAVGDEREPPGDGVDAAGHRVFGKRSLQRARRRVGAACGEGGAGRGRRRRRGSPRRCGGRRSPRRRRRRARAAGVVDAGGNGPAGLHQGGGDGPFAVARRRNPACRRWGPPTHTRAAARRERSSSVSSDSHP